MREIALHILDIAENSVAAEASTIQLSVLEDWQADRLLVSVQDDGKGMDAETAAKVVDPFVTSRTTRKVGLGIPLLKAAAEACEGELKITSTPGAGTRLDVTFKHSHIDRMPLGDLAGTVLTLVVAYPKIRWIIKYQSRPPEPEHEMLEFVFDDQPIKEELGDVPLTEPEVLAFLRTYLEQGVACVQQPLLDIV